MNLENTFRLNTEGKKIYNLPSGYKQLEYIESSGTQYIDTGVTGRGGLSTEAKAMPLTEETTGLLSCRSETEGRVYLGFRVYNSHINLGFKSEIQSAVTVVPNKVYTATYDTKNNIGKVILDGTEIINTSIDSSFNSGYTMYMFGTNAHTGIVAYAALRAYYLIIKDENNTLVRDFVPCQNASGEYGMYDMITKKFFGNAGTGTFIGGPEVKDVKHIAKDGTILWQRAVEKTTEKSGNISFENTRKAENLAYAGWAEDFVTRINNNTKAKIETFDGKNCLWFDASAGYGDYDHKYIFKTDFKENIQYRFNFDIYVTASSGNMNIIIYYTDNSASYAPLGTPSSWKNVTITSTANKTIKDIRATWVGGEQYIDLDTFMVYEGTDNKPYYPAFPHTQVLPSVKAYGKTIEAKIQEELWGRYVPVEYIESTGTQWINTEVVPTNSVSFETEIEVNTVAQDKPIIASVGSYGGASFPEGYGITCYSNRWYYGNNSGERNAGTYDPTIGTKYTIQFNKNNSIIINDITIVDNSLDINPPLANDQKLYISYRRGGTDRKGSFKYYYVKFWDNGTLIRDFIPVKDTINNVYGMWDRIEKKFYGNVGTGAFTGGDEIKKIDYLQSSGVEYIDTKYTPDAETEVEIKASLSAISSGSKYLFGSSGGERFMIAVANASQKFIFDTSSNSSYRVTSTITADLTKHIHIIKNLSYYVDGVLQGTSDHTPGTLVGTSFLMQARNSGNPAGEWKVYYAKISSNGAEIRDFIPVKIGSTGYMLDLVEWKLYANAGTGDFVCGPEIPNRLILPYKLYGNKGEIKTTKLPKEYQEVEYIESTGTQYIDTNYKVNPSKNTKFIFDAVFLSLSDSRWFGDTVNIIAVNQNRFPTRINGAWNDNYEEEIFSNIKYSIILNIENNNYQLLTNDILQQQGNRSLGDSGQKIGLFNVSSSSDRRGSPQLRLYKSIFYEDNTIVRSFIPCYRKSDNEIGLYDLINNVFYTNQGTGAFLKGANILPTIQANDAHNVTLDGVTKSINDLLYSANGYKDLQTGNVYQDWGIKVFDGTENWSKNSYGTNNYMISIADIYSIPTTEVFGFCSHIEPVDYTQRAVGSTPIVYYDSQVDYCFNFRNMLQTTVNDWKAYLAEQYANGTPIIIIYPLANPTTNAGTADAFRLTTKGNKTLSSNVAGTGVQATYLGE